jgi:modulator of FtsH protease HflK
MIPSVGILMSLNDPQWGSRGDGQQDKSQDRPKKPGGEQGPPDLEELWRDFNKKLSSLFDKKKQGGGGEPQRPLTPNEIDPKMLKGGIGFLGVAVLAIWMASGFYIVDASQRGVVLQFGKYLETTEPGLRWHFPAPFQSHEVVNLSGVRTVEIGYRGTEKNKVLKEALMLTDDENIINIQFAVQYFLKDPVDYLFENRSADDSVMQAAETAVREIVGKSKMDFVLYEGREQVATQAAKLMQDVLDRYKTGIVISKVTMQNAQPPEQVQAAFDDAVKAGQDRERQKNEGQAYANDVVPKAKGTAARLLEEANGYRQRVVVAAEGDASRFKQVLTEYAKAPEVTRQRMYLDTMQQIFTSTSKIMVDAKGQGNLLYLPLDKLMQAAAPSVVNADVAAEAQPATARQPSVFSGEVPPQLDRFDNARPELRSREALRNRDREPRP